MIAKGNIYIANTGKGMQKFASRGHVHGGVGEVISSSRKRGRRLVCRGGTVIGAKLRFSADSWDSLPLAGEGRGGGHAVRHGGALPPTPLPTRGRGGVAASKNRILAPVEGTAAKER